MNSDDHFTFDRVTIAEYIAQSFGGGINIHQSPTVVIGHSNIVGNVPDQFHFNNEPDIGDICNATLNYNNIE